MIQIERAFLRIKQSILSKCNNTTTFQIAQFVCFYTTWFIFFTISCPNLPHVISIFVFSKEHGDTCIIKCKTQQFIIIRVRNFFINYSVHLLVLYIYSVKFCINIFFSIFIYFSTRHRHFIP